MRQIRFLILLIAALLGSVGVTILLISTKMDWSIAKFFEAHPILISIGIPGVLAGMLVPVMILIISAYLAFKSNQETQKKVFWRLFQGFLIAYGLSSLLKMFTSRVDMEPFEPMGNTDFSASFRFGFMQGQHWWESLAEGWPSGHVLIAVYFLVALRYRLSLRQNLFHALYVFLIMFSVVTAFHWLSDILSGAILGAVIGTHFQLNPNYESNYSNKSR